MHKQALEKSPLLIISLLFRFMQERMINYADDRKELSALESQLGVTTDLLSLEARGYPSRSYDYSDLNAQIATAVKVTADKFLSMVTLKRHAESFLRILSQFENDTKNDVIFNLQNEIQSTIDQGELYLAHLSMVQQILQSLTAVLYNKITQNNTQSMKTIAVVTLFFLPSTFVSAIFSTGMFDFFAKDTKDDHHVISSYGWVYLVTCLVLTTSTLVTWLCWHIWGLRVLTNFKRPKWTATIPSVVGTSEVSTAVLPAPLESVAIKPNSSPPAPPAIGIFAPLTHSPRTSMSASY